MKLRLDHLMVKTKLVPTRSQAESWIRLGKVSVGGKEITKPGFFVDENTLITLDAPYQYVSRAALKLASIAKILNISFENKIVLDVGSSTGGFTQFALKNGAKMVYAVDVGTDQLHESLRKDPRIELHEKTDIRGFRPQKMPTIVVIDVSFISLREVLPHISRIIDKKAQVIAMVKPQFEAGRNQTTRGVIKNDRVRREILREFELWARLYFVVNNSSDSGVTGANGNRERFYDLMPLQK